MSKAIQLGFHGASTRELQALLGTFSTKNPTDGVNESTEEQISYRHRLMSLLSVLLYGAVGLVMGFVNKATLLYWPYSNSFLMLQMATSFFLLYSFKFLGLIDMRPPNLTTARSLFWVVLLYNANVAFALAAVQALSIPVYHVMKRLTPVTVLVMRMALGGDPPPLQITLSVLTVVAGCVFAGLGDLSFDGKGYSMAMVSCVLQASYLILVEKSGSEKGFNSNELLLYNAIMSFPVLMVLTYTTGELKTSMAALKIALAGNFIWLFIVALFLGSVLNYSLFFCTVWNSALTTSIVGSLRSVLGTILGFHLLGGVKATPLIVIGSSINTLGGIWYTAVRFHMKQEQSKPEKHETPDSTPEKV